MDTFANSQDLDEMPQNATFHQGLHCFLKWNKSSEEQIQYFLEIITCDPQYRQSSHKR